MDLKHQIQQQASKCVKCGLCSTVCPTYQLTKEEGESPRGRIALMEGIAQDKLPINNRLLNYLDHCLTCRACESICPAEVPYGHLIDSARILLKPNRTKLSINNQKHKSILKLIQHPSLFTLVNYILYFYQKTGIQRLLRKTPLLKRLKLEPFDALIPKLNFPKRFKTFYPPKTASQGYIALFINCIHPVLEPVTIESIITLLNILGFGVYIPPKQACCGALAFHQGDQKNAFRLLYKNIEAFNQYPISQIIVFTSGCSLTLTEYQNFTDDKMIQDFSSMTVDIYQFLAQIKWPDNIHFAPLAKKVLLHTPCSLKNGLGFSDIPKQLLSKIPELELMTLPNTISCCGAAGQYFLDFPETAQALLKPIKKVAEEVQPDYIVTSNIGCQLHMQTQLESIPHLHPLVILANQIRIR